jgi:shikimate kinase/3-dehydroquinate synthase
MPRPRLTENGERQHVAIVGFMGAGKSTVGRLLADRLGASFVDLDEVIVRKAGRTIAEIFREHGEVGFRAHERAALREVLEGQGPLVIATGGGTFVDTSMRGWVQSAARTVYLKASPEVLFNRIGVGPGRTIRPLLSGPDPLATIRRLLKERSSAYEQCEITVATDRASCEEVVEDVLSALKERPRASARAERTEGESISAAEDTSAATRDTPVALHAHRPGGDSPVAQNDTTRGSHPIADDAEPEQAGLLAGERALLRVHAREGSYPIEMRASPGGWIADAIAAVSPGARLAVISDTTVAALHAAVLVRDLSQLDRPVTLHTFAPGEGSKTLATAAQLYDELLGAGLARADAVVALGGGVVGDVAGFVASTFLRGVSLVQVPTTTLAAVDSSVGGKTGVNTPRGKNLVGTFHAPRAVLVASSHLATQSVRQHAAGLIEALKMAAALDAVAFEAMVSDLQAVLGFDAAALARTISRAVGLKAGVVGRDERERGERAVLNFGHTVGHAIETGEAYRLLHGEAVGLGMLAEASWAEAEGLAEGVVAPLAAALSALGAPTQWRDAHIDFAAMAIDKKRQGGGVRLPIVRRIGTYELKTVPLEQLVEYLQKRSL